MFIFCTYPLFLSKITSKIADNPTIHQRLSHNPYALTHPAIIMYVYQRMPNYGEFDRMKKLIVMMAGLLILIMSRPIQAAEDIHSIVAFAENGVGCEDSAVRFFFTYTPSTNDWNNQRDWVHVGLFDATGLMLAYNAYSAVSVSNLPTPTGVFKLRFDALGNTPTTRPFYLSFRDGDDTTSQADFGNLTELTRYPFDPVAVGATRCDKLGYTPLGIGLDDGRVNWMDNAQTAAVYCEADGSITLLAISQDTGRGLYAIRVTVREVARAGIPEEEPLLLKTDMRDEMRLYRLSTGEFQVVAPYTDAVQGTLPNGYVFIWSGCELPTSGIVR